MPILTCLIQSIGELIVCHSESDGAEHLTTIGRSLYRIYRQYIYPDRERNESKPIREAEAAVLEFLRTNWPEVRIMHTPAYGETPRPHLKIDGHRPVIFLGYDLVKSLEGIDLTPTLSTQVASIIILTGATIFHELAHLCWQHFHLSGSESMRTPFEVRFPHHKVKYFITDNEPVDLTQSDPKVGESGYALEGLVFNGVIHPLYTEGHGMDLGHLDGLYIRRVVGNRYVHKRRYVISK